jgi:hypothetical protein
LTTKPAEELDGRIAAAFSDDANSDEAARLLAEVKEAAFAAELAAETARKHALDPLLSGDDLKLARREMLDAAFKWDRLQEASAKLTERVEALKALEADRRMGTSTSALKTNGIGSPKRWSAWPIRLRRSLTLFVRSKPATERSGALRSRDSSLCRFAGQARRTYFTSSDLPVR